MEQVNKIELDFAEARKEIMALRLENRKLETALTLFSKPMVLSSDSEDDNQNKPKRNRRPADESGTVVIALPHGEAQARIDSLLQENTKLASEIVELRRIAGDGSSTTGVASIFEKNKELENQLKLVKETMASLESNHATAFRTANGKNEKEMRKLKYEKMYVNKCLHQLKNILPSELEEKIRQLEQSLLVEKDARDSEIHCLRIEIEALSKSLELAKNEFFNLSRIAAKIVANVCFKRF